MKVEYPEFTGRYKVGVTEFIVDTGREETLKLHEGGVRKLSCRMYYPTTEEGIEGKEKSEYMSRQLCAKPIRSITIRRWQKARTGSTVMLMQSPRLTRSSH